MNSKFWQVNEDPSYDEDGVLSEYIDDSDWEQAFQSDEGWTEKAIREYEAKQLSVELENFDPYSRTGSK